MRVLVDTSVWSLALRRSARSLSAAEQRLTALLRELINEGRAAMVGPVRQEILRNQSEMEDRARDIVSAEFKKVLVAELKAVDGKK